MTPGTYTAVEHDTDEGDRLLGTVTLAADGRLAIVAAAIPDDDRLQTIVDELNGEDVLHVEAPPPPGAPRFAVTTRIVERGTDGFIPALLEHLKRYNDVELHPA